jgi:hypothetical protein
VEKFRKMVGWVPILTGLVIVQGLVAFGGPCYQNTGGTGGCVTLGGPNCSIIGAFPGLPCNGGPWTLAQLAAMGRSGADPCLTPILESTIPVPDSTAENLSTGELSRGNFSYPCTAVRACTKSVTIVPPLVMWVGCINPVLTQCSTWSIFTAGGGVCPVGSGGVGGS